MVQKASNITGCFVAIFLFLCTPLGAQEKESVRWLSFEELENALAEKPKKVFIDFFTDWCTYCRKMDKSVFTNSKVIEVLNNDYYAVRFNAESDRTFTFSGQQLFNDQIGKSRTPIHQIAQLLALRDGQFSAPTLIVLNEEFKVTARYFEYMDSKKLLRRLK